MSSVKLCNINKLYDNKFHAVKDVNLQINDKDFVVLVGPSGCGKSTILRMIAGLEEISSGELYIDDALVNSVEPKDRDIAMVFQNYALYPHMTVYENMAFGLKLRKLPKDEVKNRILKVSEILGLENFLQRKPKQLSGGQRQRVALGRAIVRNPKVFLMDEPLSNLDAKLRVQMRSELVKLHKELDTTFIYVTHDQMEAMTMGNKIVVMKDGVIQQVDTPQNIYENPANKFVAEFIGVPQMNFIPCKVQVDSEIYLSFNDFRIPLSSEKQNLLKNKDYINKEVILGIRAQHIYLNEGSLEGTVDFTEYLGSENFVHIKIHQIDLIAKTQSDIKFNENTKIKLKFNEEKIYLFDKDSHCSL